MSKTSQMMSLATSIPGIPTSPMRPISKEPQSRTLESAIGTSALSPGRRALTSRHNHCSIRNTCLHPSSSDTDATGSNAPLKAFGSSGNTTGCTSDSRDTISSDRRNASEEQMAHQSRLISLSTIPNSYSTISSPGLSTFRRAGAKISIAMGYSSQNMWDTDTDESESLCESPSFTRTNIVTNKNLTDMALHFKEIDLSPTVTIRRNPTRSKRNSPTRSTHSSPWRSIVRSNESPSMWDPDDDEFDQWPGQETLDRIGSNFTLHRGTSRRAFASKPDVIPGASDRTEDDDCALMRKEADVSSKTYYANLSEQQHEDLIHELLDKECGNPYGPDANDDLMRQFHSSSVTSLPTSNPACHMHVLNWEAYMNSENDLVRNALPRLCDAVATVLYLTSPQCLEDFLNPDVETFEWRRDGHCLMIRREGNEVIVGAWKETYAAVAGGVTRVSAQGVELDEFESEPSALGISPIDEKYALYMVRELAFFLLQKEVWNYRRHIVWTVLWEADGVVTIPKEHNRYQTWNIKEDDE